MFMAPAVADRPVLARQPLGEAWHKFVPPNILTSGLFSEYARLPERFSPKAYVDHVLVSGGTALRQQGW